MKRLHLLIVSSVLASSCGGGEPTVGAATVIDGDSLTIDATTIRLFGIDAPEGRQTCKRGGVEWACGRAAARALGDLVRGRTLACEKKDTDTYGRTVAVCRVGDRDVNEEMVLAGMALAYRRFGSHYAAAEVAAKRARRGVWAGEFTPPWDWRQSCGRSGTAPRAPSRSVEGVNCTIKGNINGAGERIYHVPGGASYDETRIDPARGERYFCSEREARDAGWRAPKSRR
jgi:endonuclease YncB( thermonuclease family)